MTKRPPIFTIGYEGASIPAFITALREAGVSLVLDIRAVPASRKKGFSKTPLAVHLAEAGIGYRHLRGLGTPKRGRDAAHGGDRDAFERIFLAHMAEPEALLDLGEALGHARQQPTCLLCLERDPQNCHRLIVAERMARESGQEIHHLFVEDGPSLFRG
jgi:uncharacterized protein (DUF488 family)